MFRLIVKTQDSHSNYINLETDIFHHLSRVLRIQNGDSGEIVIQNEKILEIKVIELKNKTLFFQKISEKQIPKSKLPKITLAQALPKQDKFAEIIKKCTEIGVSSFMPVMTSRSISQPKDHAKKHARWEKVIHSACIQSKQYDFPNLYPIQSFKEFLKSIEKEKYDLKLVPWEEEVKESHLKSILQKHNKVKNILIFIGPEGGISSEEINLLKKIDFHSVSLGETVLRVENAGFLTCANIFYEYT